MKSTQLLLNKTKFELGLDLQGAHLILISNGTQAEANIEILHKSEKSIHFLVTINQKVTEWWCTMSPSGSTTLWSKAGSLKVAYADTEFGMHQSTNDQDNDGIVKAPIAGKIVETVVSEGDLVEKNTVLLVLEAMKMENEVKAPLQGRIKKVFRSTNDSVDAEEPLVMIEPSESGK